MKTRITRGGLVRPALAVALALAAAAAPTMAQNAGGTARPELRDRASSGLRGVAQAGLRDMIAQMGRGQPASGRLPADFPIAVATFGELRQVTLGAGYEVNTIDPAALMYAGKSADLGRLTKGTGVWNFLLLSKGQPVAVLEVGLQGGRWQVLGAGATRLAKDIQTAAKGYAGGGDFRFVRIYQARADLMEVQGADRTTRYVPLAQTGQTLGLQAKAGAMRVLPTGSDLLPSLQDAVRSNLAQPRR